MKKEWITLLKKLDCFIKADWLLACFFFSSRLLIGYHLAICMQSRKAEMIFYVLFSFTVDLDRVGAKLRYGQKKIKFCTRQSFFLKVEFAILVASFTILATSFDILTTSFDILATSFASFDILVSSFDIFRYDVYKLYLVGVLEAQK